MSDKEKIKTLHWLVAFLIVALIASGVYIVNNELNEDISNTTETVKQEGTSDDSDKSNSISIEDEIQKVFDDAYKTISGGAGIIDYTNMVNIETGDEGAVGGVKTVEAYEVNFTKIEKYFTDRALSYMKVYFTDTPYGHKDGKYYIYSPYIQSERKKFINTVFGEIYQDQKRNIKIKLYNNDTVLAISEKSSFIELNEYIVFKKIDNTWKIDMFEEF